MRTWESGFSSSIILRSSEDLFAFSGSSHSNKEIGVQESSVRKILSDYTGIFICSLFSPSLLRKISNLQRLAELRDSTYKPISFHSYFAIHCRESTDAFDIINRLRKETRVKLVYLQNELSSPRHNKVHNSTSISQGYLEPAPLGISVNDAWKLKGGKGSGSVKLVDIEKGWLFHHKDLDLKSLRESGKNHYSSQDHGAAVMGVILMKPNGNGKSGIVPLANGFVVSLCRSNGTINTADALLAAITQLKFGDIILIETQEIDSTTGKFWPIETQEVIYLLVRLATALGIIVIEAAGNGHQENNKGNDLDRFKLGNRNIFQKGNRYFRDSGSIMVAGATSHVPHERMKYSNFGSRIDCYAWGENVFTCGNLPGISGWATNTYTNQFSGTSSASAIIAGVAISVQSIAEINFGCRLSPRLMRNLLSNEDFGTASREGIIKDKIGIMPDLKKIMKYLPKFLKVNGVNSENNHPKLSR